MSTDLLHVKRTHADGQPTLLGYELEIPPMVIPDEPVQEKEAEERLQWEFHKRAGTHFTGIQPTGLCAPSTWERRYLQWLSEMAGAPIVPGWDNADENLDPPNHPELRKRLAQARPWSGPEEIPDGVQVRRCASARIEAVAAARQVRRWLGDRLGTSRAAAACQDVLILLPPGRGAAATWFNAFSAMDLPVRAVLPSPLSMSPLGQWVLALCSLVGWSDTEPRGRDTLDLVWQSPFWSASKVTKKLSPGSSENDRSGLRSFLGSATSDLRRPRVTLEAWHAHLGRSSDSPAELVSLARDLAASVATALRPGEGLVDRLLGLLHPAGDMFGLGVSSALGGMKQKELLGAWGRLLPLLRELAREEAEADGVHPSLGDEAPQVALANLLRQQMARAATVQHERPAQGVTLMPYDIYDGRASTMLFLAGLGEGGFPAVPPVPTQNQQAWIKWMGGPDNAEAWINQELERQIELASHAIGACSGEVTLSFFREDQGTGEVYPGPLLSLLVGGWDHRTWAREGRAEDLGSAALFPNKPDDAACWHEARAGALDLEVQGLDQLEEEPRRRAEELVGTRARLAPSFAGHAERNPPADSAETFPTGPYSGTLGCDPRKKDLFSATALERYGECPYKYFLEKVLHLEDEEEASEELDVMETGSLVHGVLARAAWAAIDAAPNGTWDLFYDESVEDARDALVDRTMELVRPCLEQSLEEACKDRPSMSRALLDRVGDSWSQAMRNWVTVHATPMPPADPAAVDATPGVKKVLDLYNELQLAAPWIGQLEQEVEPLLAAGKTQKEIKPTMKARKFPGRLNLGRFGKALSKMHKASDEVRAATWQELRNIAAEDLEQWGEKVEEAREKVRAKWQAARPGRVAHAELAFGFEEPTEGSDPQSVIGPFTLQAGGEAFRLRGEIDRVDWDPDRKLWAVRDYKSGKNVSLRKMTERARLGFQLQLALYNLALEALVEAGHLPRLSGGKGHLLALEYPKVANPRGKKPSPATTAMSLEAPAPLTLDGAPASWCDIAAAWAGHHVRGIRGGLFPLLPAHCPKVQGSAWCDYQRVCGYSPDAREVLVPPQEPPRVEAVEQESKTTDKDTDKGKVAPERPALLPPDVGLSHTDHEAARRKLPEVQQAVCDLKRDLVISAGAGTGKTYNLVLRYLTALAQGLSPQQILCITFTRKAAAEMAHRVRHALLGASDEVQRPLVERIKSDPARYRQILLTLSAAPISTIDSLALRILREAEAIRAARRGDGEPPLEPSVVAPSEVAGALERHVSDRFLEAVEGGDPRMARLLEAITPGRLKAHLLAAVKTHDPARTTDDADQIMERWHEICRYMVHAVRGALVGLDIDEGDRLLAAARAGKGGPTAKGDEEVTGLLDAARRLRDDPSLPPEQALRDAATVGTFSLARKSVKDEPLCDWILQQVAPILHRSDSPTTEAAALLGEMKKRTDPHGDLKRWGELACAAGELVRQWDEAFAEQLRRQGNLRYKDAERAATRALEDPELKEALRQRFPFEHLFMDESQDTSEGQVALVMKLGQLCKARQFWVGDIKQSIYRFRGAEVDMFQRVLKGEVLPGAHVVDLTVNWRSSAPLIRAFNRLFCALLPASRGGLAQDPGSSMDYDPLGWPRDRDEDPAKPAVTLLAHPGKGWLQEEEEAQDPGSSGDQEEADPERGSDLLERAMVRQLQLLLEAEDRRREAAAARGEPRPRLGPDAVILVPSWVRANHYRDLLREWGVRAEVQGGRGLLATEEIDHLMQWLEAALLASRVGLMGALRGPGVGISDAGLVCLKRGFGVVNGKGEQKDGALSPRVLSYKDRRLDPDLAAAQWTEATGEDTAGLLPVLRTDAAMFRRWLELYQAFFRRCAAGDLSGAVEDLLNRADLRAWWSKQVRGRDRLANLTAFQDYLREMEEAGRAPSELVRALIAQKDVDDPAAGGLGGDLQTRVSIMTYYQAKGREWPIVVVPDMHLADIRTDNTGLSVERVVPPNSDEAVHLPLMAETLKESPLEASCPGPVKGLTNLWRMPAERAELRRLFYVALTRAERHLLLTGEFKRPVAKESLPHLEGRDHGLVYTLGQANNWAATLMVALDLSFNDTGAPVLGAGGAWSEADVRLPGLEELASGLADQTGPAAVSRTTLTAELMRAWTPVTSEDDPLLSPSDLDGEQPPEPTDRLGDWPLDVDGNEHLLSPTKEGNALHATLEAWGYQDGEKLNQDLVLKVLRQQDLAPHECTLEVAQNILHLARLALAQRPELVADLRSASERGEVYHEIPFRYRNEAGEMMKGIIDLLWHDPDGWHILDYKAGRKAVDCEAPLTSLNMMEHYAQVRCYADAVLSLTGEKPVDYGIWYTSYGLVVRWRG